MKQDPGPEAKKAQLSRPVEHIDMTRIDARPVIDGMAGMSFSARDLARAARIYNQMLEDPDCTIILTLAGSTQAAGCMAVYADMICYNMVDCVIATGAAIVDMDFFEALGYRHYQGNADADDVGLRAHRIDRIYDTLIDEDELERCDRTIAELAATLEPGPASSRAFIGQMGRWLNAGNAKKQGSLTAMAHAHGVPVFCPAFVDSSAGFGLVLHQEEHAEAHVVLDPVRDFRELAEVKIKAGTTGLLMVGGGVPKNFAQDAVVCATLLGAEVDMHKYAVQVTVADPRDGACSSSTLKEAGSWGKVDGMFEQMVFAEATTALPLIASDAYHRGHWRARPRRRWQDLFG